MKKFLFLFLCLSGIGMTYAEEVNIGLYAGDECEEGYIHLEFLPRCFFLDNNCVIYNRENRGSKDQTVYDYYLSPSTIHFNCERLDEEVYLQDYGNGIITTNDSQMERSPFSQCFFNNDALYECITYDETIFDEELGYEVSGSFNTRVINQNGDVLYTFEEPEGCKRSSSPMFFKVSDDVIIVRMVFSNYDYTQWYGCYYSLKIGQTSSMAPIRQMYEMKLSRNTISKGDNLVVTISGESCPSNILVTSLSGITVKEVPVIDGRAVIATSDLSSGLYIASQKNGTSAKFIVK